MPIVKIGGTLTIITFVEDLVNNIWMEVGRFSSTCNQNQTNHVWFSFKEAPKMDLMSKPLHCWLPKLTNDPLAPLNKTQYNIICMSSTKMPYKWLYSTKQNGNWDLIILKWTLTLWNVYLCNFCRHLQIQLKVVVLWWYCRYYFPLNY